MDPLSVTASIVGILAAAGKITELLSTFISSAQDAPQVVLALVCETSEVHAALSSLHILLTDLSTAPPRRAALIQVDQLIVTLTESVLTFSELEGIITPLTVPRGQRFPLKTRWKWTRVEGSCVRIVERLQRHKASISLMLNIMQCASDAEAGRSQGSLENMVELLLDSNQELCKRMRNLEDAFDARSIITKKFDSMSLMTTDDNETITTARPIKDGPPTILEAVKVRFAFDEALESSRVYRRAKNDQCDCSFVSSAIRTQAWSIFSGLSLADISVISVVALPLYPGDIRHQEYYSFGETIPPPPPEASATWTNSQAVVEIEHAQAPKHFAPFWAVPEDIEEQHDSEPEPPFPSNRPPLARVSLDSDKMTASIRDDVDWPLSTVHDFAQFKESLDLSTTEDSTTDSLWTNEDVISRVTASTSQDSIEATKGSSIASPASETPISSDPILGAGADNNNVEKDEHDVKNDVKNDEKVDDKADDKADNKADDKADNNDDEEEEEEEELYPCTRCNEILEEGKAYELGGKYWHLQCFSCSTCGDQISSESNLLVLGDGTLLCPKCTYNCAHCKEKIGDLAIVTGDQAYCAKCFRCRNCKRKIENLRYARTSQGYFCMSCHEALMARRRKKARQKKEARQEEEAQKREMEKKALEERQKRAQEKLEGFGALDESELDALWEGTGMLQEYRNRIGESSNSRGLD